MLLPADELLNANELTAFLGLLSSAEKGLNERRMENNNSMISLFCYYSAKQLVDAFVKSFSPTTIANLGLRFDFLGCVVDGIGDFVAVHVDPDISPKQVSIFKISRAGNKLSKDPLSICADIAVITAMKKTGNGLLYLRIDGSLVTTLFLKLSVGLEVHFVFLLWASVSSMSAFNLVINQVNEHKRTAVKSGLWWRSYCKETEGNNGGYGFAAKNLKLGRFGTGWELFTRKFDPKMWIEGMKLLPEEVQGAMSKDQR
nr:homoserine kinase-like [Ipomoea batatas]